MKVADVARICHEANKALCESQGDKSQKSWNEAEPEFIDSTINAVNFNLANPNAPASANHDSWLAERGANGWKYGKVKDIEAKLHPCFVPYNELPPEQQAKDHLFKAIVAGLAPFVENRDEYQK